MDELSVLPPEGPRISPTHIRRTSNLRPPYRPGSSSAISPNTATSSITAHLEAPKQFPERHEIIAPTPRRHLIESSASQHWLRSGSISPVSSRAVSPASAYSVSSSTNTQRPRPHHTSFSALLERDNPSRAMLGTSGTRLKSERADTETAMGRRWIRWLHKKGMKDWVVPGAIFASTFVKCCMGLGSYSGQGTPPMYGDYEAQRHWMELTIHLPLRQWYAYDLQYWGLDYPPLTAYVSWVCGITGSWINPSWFALDTSRGIETESSKVFMRSTVVLFDAIVYVPALLLFVRTWQGSRSKRTQEIALLTLLFQPALLLVDFGHFQYNSVMLGLTLLTLNFFATGQDLLGAVCFVLSLGFKQMALYYAPAIGSYLLAKCLYLGPSQGRTLFVRLAAVTSITFLLLFLPFLPPFSPISRILDPITRIFPFSRGLFEDKVANFWCASNVLIKWKAWASRGFLVKLSTGLTALGFLPTVFALLQAGFKHRPTEEIDSPTSPKNTGTTQTSFLPLLPYALLNSSMSFFLFSFQVHEKTILLPLLPITLLLSGAPVDSSLYSWGVLVNNTAVFSMWPLLKRDGLSVQYIATLLLWNRIIGHNPFRQPTKSLIQLLSVSVYTAAFGLHIMELIVSPPSRFPDLYPVLNVLVCTPVFVLTWLWSIKCGIEVGWALGGLGSGSAKPVAERRSSIGSEASSVEVKVSRHGHGGKRTMSLGSLGEFRRRGAYGSSSRASSVLGRE